MFASRFKVKSSCNVPPQGLVATHDWYPQLVCDLLVRAMDNRGIIVTTESEEKYALDILLR